MEKTKHKNRTLILFYFLAFILLLAQFGFPLWVLQGIKISSGLRYLILTLFRFLMIFLILIVEKNNINKYYISKINLNKSIKDGIIFTLFFIPIAIGYAYIKLGGIYWIKVNDIFPTFLAALIPAALEEEIAYRGIFLGVLKNKINLSKIISILIIGLIFGPLHHIRYIFRGDFLTLSIVTIFGFFAAWLTIKRKNMWGAVISHAAMDFLIFVFIGGKITNL